MSVEVIESYDPTQTTFIEVFTDAFNKANSEKENPIELVRIEILKQLVCGREFALTIVKAGGEMDALDPVFAGELAAIQQIKGRDFPNNIYDLDREASPIG